MILPLARLRLRSMLAVLLLAASVSAAAATTPAVRIDGGLVVGTESGPARVFRALPYAAPPTGALRWQPPAPPVSWTGTRDAVADDVTGSVREALRDYLESTNAALPTPFGPENYQEKIRGALALALTGKGAPPEAGYKASLAKAATALAWGLVNAVVPQSELIPAAKEWAGKVTSNGPLARRRSSRQ